MNVRKEPIVFLLVAAALGYQGMELYKDSGTAGRPPKPRALDYESVGLDDLSLVRPEAGRGIDFERNLFAPPSATSPLPPLSPELPPFAALPALAPPTAFGPEPRWFSDLLREPASPEAARQVPGLFDVREVPVEVETEVLEIATGDEGAELPDDPEARAARIAGLKQQYDWIYTNGFQFGRILNEDRYRIEFSPESPLLFTPVNPATGVPLYPKPIEYGPDRVREWGLVENALTGIELGFAAFGDPLSPTKFNDAIRFAEDCLRMRNETPRALEVAEELFRRAQAINTQDDVGPRLGLARCYELGFRLEEAYRTYQSLLDDGFDTSAVVHSRFGSLLAKLRLDGDAEESFREGLRVERANWEGRWRYGRFLMERGRATEAVEHLTMAVQREPKGSDDRIWRVRVRLDHGRVLLMTGDGDGAFQAFNSALMADVANDLGLADVCLAGLLSAAPYSDAPMAAAMAGMGAEAGLPGDADVPGAAASIGGGQGIAGGGFELLVASGLSAMGLGELEAAAQVLQSAVAADPFRSIVPLRALSRLAEISGNPEDAVAFADRALEARPLDPWTLYQQGRLAEAASDEPRAREAYQAALDQELDFVAALERMAALTNASEEYAAAERYYERAVSLEPKNAELWSRRGWNALSALELGLARTCFERARGLSAGLGAARAGLAWWHYASGDPAEALTLFGEIVDDSRATADSDPLALFARDQSARIQDHGSKEVFRDRFDRQDGAPQNGWTVQMGVGPEVSLRDGAIHVAGQHDRGGRSRAYRALPPDRFIAFSCLVTVGTEAKGTRSGIFIASERTSSNGVDDIRSEIVLSRNRDGQLEVRVQRNATDDEAAFVRVPGPEWPIGEPIRVSIEKTGEDLDSRYTLYVDGEPVADGLEVSGMSASRQNVRFGAFVEGEPGRRADLTVDDVRVVRRK